MTGDMAQAATTITGALVDGLRMVAYGAIPGFFGAIAFGIGVYNHARGRQVFRRGLAVFLPWLPFFPLGTSIAVTGLILLFTRKRRYRQTFQPLQQKSQRISRLR